MFQELYAEWKVLFVSAFFVAFVASYVAAMRRYDRPLTRFLVSVLIGVLASWMAAITVGVVTLGAETARSLATVLGVFKFLGLVAVGVVPPVLVSLLAALIGYWRGSRRRRKLRAV